MKTLLSSILFTWGILFSSYSFGEPDTLLIQKNMPDWVKPVLEKSEIAKKHQILTDFNPFYFEADFTGDGQVDIAFFVENKLDKTRGVMIVNNVKNLAYVIGCGNATDMGTSLSWTERWFVYRNRYIVNSGNKKKVTLKTPAIQLVRNENNSLVIYWAGKKYKTFIHQS